VLNAKIRRNRSGQSQPVVVARFVQLNWDVVPVEIHANLIRTNLVRPAIFCRLPRNASID
jgi:hypothetical protein